MKRSLNFIKKLLTDFWKCILSTLDYYLKQIIQKNDIIFYNGIMPMFIWNLTYLVLMYFKDSENWMLISNVNT